MVMLKLNIDVDTVFNKRNSSIAICGVEECVVLKSSKFENEVETVSDICTMD